MKKKKNIIMIVLAGVIYLLAQQQGGESPSIVLSEINAAASIHNAFVSGQSDVQIQGSGVVKKVLADDRKGLQHQKFILQTSPDQTVLVAHNIDISKRIPGLKKGDVVHFYGEYEWTQKGGVIHWTHRDPSGRHADGWLKCNGKTYQ